MKPITPASLLLFGLWCSLSTIAGAAILTWQAAQALNRPCIQLPLPLQMYVAPATIIGGFMGAVVGICIGMAVIWTRRRVRRGK